MQLKKSYIEFTRLTQYSHSLALLFARLSIGYGFYNPAMNKWQDMPAIIKWFDSLGIFLPTISAYLAASVESIGVILLVLGLFTRIISIPLMFVMFIAITFVHLENGFSIADQGFEIPLYYFIFLMIFLSQGSGRFSLDHLFFEHRDS